MCCYKHRLLKIFLFVCQYFHCPSSLQIVRLAVYGMLPRNLHRRTMMQRLHIFPEDVSPVSHHLANERQSGYIKRMSA